MNYIEYCTVLCISLKTLFCFVFRLVNHNRTKKGIMQMCEDDLLEVGDNWVTFYWPSSESIDDFKGSHLSTEEQVLHDAIGEIFG